MAIIVSADQAEHSIVGSEGSRVRLRLTSGQIASIASKSALDMGPLVTEVLYVVPQVALPIME